MKVLKRNSRQFEPAPAGTFSAIITVLADLGLQTSNFAGESSVKPQIGIAFELADETGNDGQKLAVQSTYTSSLHEKAKLTQVIRAALGTVPDELDLADLLGKAVSVTIIHRESADGRTWSNVESVGGLPAKAKQGVVTDSPLLFFDLDDPDPGVYQRLGALFKKKITNRVRVEESPGGPDEYDDDLPW